MRASEEVSFEDSKGKSSIFALWSNEKGREKRKSTILQVK